MEKYIINGQAIEWDTFDIANMELFDSEVKRVKEETEKIKTEKVTEENYLEILKEQCENMVDFFACVLGEDVAETLFRNKRNIKEIIEAYGDFTKAVTVNRQNLGAMLQYHTPKAQTLDVSVNREQRRRMEREQRRKEAAERAKKKAQEQKIDAD